MDATYRYKAPPLKKLIAKYKKVISESHSVR